MLIFDFQLSDSGGERLLRRLHLCLRESGSDVLRAVPVECLHFEDNDPLNGGVVREPT